MSAFKIERETTETFFVYKVFLLNFIKYFCTVCFININSLLLYNEF